MLTGHETPFIFFISETLLKIFFMAKKYPGLLLMLIVLVMLPGIRSFVM